MNTTVARRETCAKGMPSFGNRLVKGFAILSAAAILVASTAASAAGPDKGAHFKHLLASGSAKAAVNRKHLDHKRVTVVVEMAGDSVASVRALSPDHTITDQQRDSIRLASVRQAASIEPEITARGGSVLARFHSAINGVKATIDKSQIESLRGAPGVVAVRAVRTYHMNNVESVPFIGAPLAWQGSPGYLGEKQKIVIIDTGIDYTHANFGGPGTVDAFETAAATSTLPADPKLFGPKAVKVKGGIDLVGDDYDADSDVPANTVPKPDPNPLDCNGHGSHVAGTATGYGVAANGSTYKGPYTAAAIKPANFIIGPGVAPKADLYSVRVFGCEGTTNVVIDAIDWAIEHNMDVINMSLGSVYGSADDADAVEVVNAAKAGVVVVASSGNSGPIPYITGSPGVSDAAVSVASVDSHQSFPGAQITLNTGSVLAINANGAPLPSGALAVTVLRDATGAVSLGCDEAEYVDAQIAGKLVVTLRGVCARVDRATFGQRHGAAAVVMINTDDTYPPYEGPIPDVTIPFLGVLPDDGTVVANAASATQFVAQTIANGAYRAVSDFSSAGPRFGDSVLKPNVTAPGTSIFSTNVGTGNQGIYISGTSMASPHVAGVAALTTQAHPKWDPKTIRAAIVQTASPKALVDYAPSSEGSGLVQPLGATRTQAVAFAEGPGSGQSIAFGFEEFLRTLREERDVTVRNLGDSSITFKVTSTKTGGAPHTLNLSRSTVTVGAHQDARFEVSLSVPVETVGATHDEDGNPLFPEVAGYVTLTPASSSMNKGVALTLPYYLVPRARSNVIPLLAGRLSPSHPKSQVLVTNILGGIPGTADFYAWGLQNKRPQGVTSYDTRAVGVQSILGAVPNDSILVFAINTFDRFSAANLAEFDINVDVNGDNKPDFLVMGIDNGLITTGDLDGNFATVIFNLATGDGFVESLADAPTDGSTILLPLLASDIGVTAANPRFTYTVLAANVNDGTSATLPGKASFNAFSPSITNADAFTELDRNRVQLVPVSINPKEWVKTPALGLMIVSTDNKSGDTQGFLIPAK
ncbi:MAG: S8 family serine peptidase [Gammaproteobacteria bacterium]